MRQAVAPSPILMMNDGAITSPRQLAAGKCVVAIANFCDLQGKATPLGESTYFGYEAGELGKF